MKSNTFVYRMIFSFSIGVFFYGGAFFGVPSAQAKSFTRAFKKGDSLKKLAVRFYERKDYARFIKAASHLKPFGKKKLAEGTTLNIPTTWTYRLRRDDTWENLGVDYLGDPRRGSLLAKMNYKNPQRKPPAGHLINIPFHVPVVASKNTSISKVAKTFSIGLSRPRSKQLVKLIQKYNFFNKSDLQSGEKVLVPVFHVRVKQALLATEGPCPDPGSQRRAKAVAATMKKLLKKGQYSKAAGAALKGIIEAPRAPGIVARIYLYLCTAYVALDEKALANGSAKKALELDPNLSLPPQRISPKVRAVFKAVGSAP